MVNLPPNVSLDRLVDVHPWTQQSDTYYGVGMDLFSGVGSYWREEQKQTEV